MALVEGLGEEGLSLLSGRGMAEAVADARSLKPQENGLAPLVGGIPLKTIEGLVFANDRSRQVTLGSAGKKTELKLLRSGGTEGEGHLTCLKLNDDVSLEGGGKGNSCVNGSEVVVAPLMNGKIREGPAVDESPEEDPWLETLIQCLDEKVDKSSLTVEALQLLRLVPEGYIPLPHQVGGHRHVDGKLGFLRRKGQPQFLFKPIQAGAKGPREVAFYDSLFTGKERDLPLDLQQLKQLIPQYHGIEEIQDRAGDSSEFMKLEDITHKFNKPCIMDVKIGRRVWDDFAEKDKIEREKKKYPPQEIIGFRIIGMRVYRTTSDDYVYFDKTFGRSVTVDRALEALSNFFMDGTRKRADIIQPLLEKLHVFCEWFESQRSLKLFATSLLIVYEGSPTSPNRNQKQDCSLDVRLVDFAHTYERAPGDTAIDENALFGLRHFISFVQRLD